MPRATAAGRIDIYWKLPVAQNQLERPFFSNRADERLDCSRGMTVRHNEGVRHTDGVLQAQASAPTAKAFVHPFCPVDGPLLVTLRDELPEILPYDGCEQPWRVRGPNAQSVFGGGEEPEPVALAVTHQTHRASTAE